MVLPGIIPRAKELGTSGFGYLAFLFASVYQAVRILPPDHPYTKYENVGKFGIIEVISAAANNIEVKRRNIDQIIIFLALIAAVILMVMQFALLILALLTGRAYAQTGDTSGFQSMFVTPHPESDIAFLLLDYVFGIPASGGEAGAAFFGSNALMETNGPSPFHLGMHALFNFYNIAILVVAVVIFLYYVFVVVMETAQTGVPFGKRFAKIYAPMRLVAAIGLLVPLNNGFNSAQYITLYTAKIGSSFATNGWDLFTQNIIGSKGGNSGGGGITNVIGAPDKSLVARPKTPAIDHFLYFASVYHTCREAYNSLMPQQAVDPGQGRVSIDAYVIIDGKAEKLHGGESGGLSYDQVKKAFGNNDMEIILGEHNESKHKSEAGNVRAYCGRIAVSLNFDNPASFRNTTAKSENSASQPTAVRAIESMYFGTIKSLLEKKSSPLVWQAFGERIALMHKSEGTTSYICHGSDVLNDQGTCKDERHPPVSSFARSLHNYADAHERLTLTAYESYRSGLDLSMTEDLRRRGWGGAGIWYNTIADINGVFTGAVYAAPTIKRYPELMEKVKREREMNNVDSTPCNMFEPNLKDGRSVPFEKTTEHGMATAMNTTFRYFACNEEATTDGGSKAVQAQDGNQGSAGKQGKTGVGSNTNAFLRTIEMIFGLNGLFDIRENSKIDETTGHPIIHPLAQLSTVGKSLIENAIRSVGMAIGTAFGGGIVGALYPHLGAALASATSMFIGIATIGLTVGFILYYVLPFLPFIYFFFAVGTWVKSVFEAMVGVPLWALAHLKIDGEGFSGRAAKAGYLMLLEIMLRPIVTVFGLIGGMAVFGALAGMLNELFDLVVANITGVSAAEGSAAQINIGEVESVRRGIVDQLFFTVMYAVLLYLMATSSFKMIDSIPKQFMRWMGESISTFNDSTEDPTSGLTRYVAIGGQQISSKVFGGMTEGAKSIGQLGGGVAKKMMSGDTT